MVKSGNSYGLTITPFPLLGAPFRVDHKDTSPLQNPHGIGRPLPLRTDRTNHRYMLCVWGRGMGPSSYLPRTSYIVIISKSVDHFGVLVLRRIRQWPAL